MFVSIIALQFNKVKELFGLTSEKGTYMTILEEPDIGTSFENSKQTMVQIHIYTDLTGTVYEGSTDADVADAYVADTDDTDTDISDTIDTDADSAIDGQKEQIVNPRITDSEIYGSFGSGSIWEYDKDSILVVTNYHVISPVVTKDALGYAVFYNGVISEFEVAAFDPNIDCAFLLIDASCMDEEQLLNLRCVYPYDMDEDVTGLVAEQSMFVVHSKEISRSDMVDGNTLNMIADTSYAGYIMEPSVYVSALLQDMLYCKCSADAGMSGGPTFDAYGHYIGMLTGATDTGETVSVVLSDIEEVYDQIGER